MIINLEDKILNLTQTPSDINEHIPIIVEYGKHCDHITEMGVRGILSTWGWLASKPKKLICYDLHHPSMWQGDLQSVYDVAQSINVNFEFILGDSLQVEIEQTDLLFIDTWHVYDQLKYELERHHTKVNKFICLHDTTSYEFNNESISSANSFNKTLTKQGLWPAVEEFLENNTDWVLFKRFTNNNGFTILKRKTYEL